MILHRGLRARIVEGLERIWRRIHCDRVHTRAVEGIEIRHRRSVGPSGDEGLFGEYGSSRLYHADEVIDGRGIDIFGETLAANLLNARRKLSVPIVPSGARI